MFYFLLKYSMLGGLLMLDSAAIGQWMFSHPIIAAPLIGLVGGDPLAGLIIGVLCQLFWSHKMPVGAYNPPETSLFAISCMINYLLAGNIGSIGIFHPLMILVLLVGLLGGIFGGDLTVSIRKFNNRFALLADQWATEGAFGKIQLIPAISLALTWSLYTGFLYLLGCLFYLLYPLFIKIPIEGRYIIYYPWILLAISVAVLIEINHSLKRWKILMSGVAFGCLAGFLHGYFIR